MARRSAPEPGSTEWVDRWERREAKRAAARAASHKERVRASLYERPKVEAAAVRARVFAAKWRASRPD